MIPAPQKREKEKVKGKEKGPIPAGMGPLHEVCYFAWCNSKDFVAFSAPTWAFFAAASAAFAAS